MGPGRSSVQKQNRDLSKQNGLQQDSQVRTLRFSIPGANANQRYQLDRFRAY